MRRAIAGSTVACILAVIIAACGGPSPASPTGNPGTGGGGGGGGITPPVNTAPQIKSLTVSDARAEVGTPITVTALVEDLETPVANLTYQWTADTGAFSGTGAAVTWVAGQDAKTPADVNLTLTVIESYTSGSVASENKVTSTTSVHVNNSPKELADLSMRFLGDFATSSVPPAKCVSEFSDACSGKKDELNDLDDNRHDFLIIASTLRPTSVELAPTRLTAKVHTFCSFTSRVITTQPRDENCQNGACPLGSEGSVQGDCWTADVYEKGRWWICESHFTGKSPLTALARAFFGFHR
jgi:hypothetical protein